jgi:hypothetical protein
MDIILFASDDYINKEVYNCSESSTSLTCYLGSFHLLKSSQASQLSLETIDAFNLSFLSLQFWILTLIAHFFFLSFLG